MMGPEAMGIKAQNYDWWDERVCRNFLFGTCPHLVFGNTVSCTLIKSSLESRGSVLIMIRKWISVLVQRSIPILS